MVGLASFGFRKATGQQSWHLPGEPEYSTADRAPTIAHSGGDPGPTGISYRGELPWHCHRDTCSGGMVLIEGEYLRHSPPQIRHPLPGQGVTPPEVTVQIGADQLWEASSCALNRW